MCSPTLSPANIKKLVLFIVLPCAIIISVYYLFHNRVKTIVNHSDPRNHPKEYRLNNNEPSKPGLVPIAGYAKNNSFKDTINVRTLGIVGDGKADVTKQVQIAISKASRQNAALYFPAGNYIISNAGVEFSNSNIAILGDVNGHTVFLPGSAKTETIFHSALSSSAISNVIISHVTFKCVSRTSTAKFAIKLYGNSKNILVEYCKFTDVSQSYIWINNSSQITISNSKFENLGKRKEGCFVLVLNGSEISINKNSFSGYYQGLNVVPQNIQKADDITVEGNYFDGQWYLTQEALSGSGNAVSYTSNTLTDKGADFMKYVTSFSTLPRDVARWKLVRVIFPRKNGKGSLAGNVFYDAGANYLSNGVIAGEIIQSGNYRGIIDSVLSQTKLKVEYWYKKENIEVTGLKAQNMDYIIYGIYLGRATNYSKHVVKVKYWHDLDGKVKVPPAKSRYEIISLLPIYGIHFTKNTANISIIKNIVLRNYADQISFFGGDAVIKGNFIKDGQDVGITVTNKNNSGSIVADNYIQRQGTTGISIFGRNNNIEDNVIIGPLYTAYSSATNKNLRLGGIVVQGGTNNLISRNSIDLKKTEDLVHGISIDIKVKEKNRIQMNRVSNSKNGSAIKQFSK